MEAVWRKTRNGFKLPRSDSGTVAHKTRMGFNLIESAIVLGVVGLVIGAIWVASAKFYEDYKVNKTVEGVLTIAQNVQNLISIRDAEAIGSSTTILTPLISAEAIPLDWISGSTAKHPFGSIIDMTTSGSLPNFRIALNHIPKSACVKLLTTISSRPNALTAQIIVEGDSYWWTSAFPIDLPTAKTGCSGVDNRVHFWFPYTRIN